MSEVARIEKSRKAFAGIMKVFDDATLVAAEGQATQTLSAARQSCDRLLALLESSLARLQRIRGRLE